MADEPTLAPAAAPQGGDADEKQAPTLLGGEKPSEPKAEDKPSGDEKGADAPADKPADAPSVDPKAFKLPDGFTADDKALTDFATIANESKIPQEVAQKFLDMHASALKTASETSSKYWADLQKEWDGANKEAFGPEPNKNPKIIAVSKMIDSLGEKPASALREALDMSGMGNHPAVIAAFTALAERLGEPAHAKGDPPSKPQDPAQAFYPSMKQG